jgi:FkbM family methyltransferase
VIGVIVRLRGLTRDLFRRAGIDVRRYRPSAFDGFAAQRLLLRASDCRVVFDVGAYEGEVTAAYAEAFPEAAVHAFEPFPPTYQRLSERFQEYSNIHLINAAVSSRKGEAVFHVNKQASTNSLLPRPASGRRYFAQNGAASHAITVPTITLDEYCAEQEIPPPDILKLDIQGNELEALRGAEQLLCSGDVSLIYTEVMFVPHYEGSVLFNTLSSHLNERGYTLFNLYDLHWASMGQLRFGDALFVSDRIRRNVIDRFRDEP